MYSLTGNRQGAEEGQDESRALVGAFPGEGALKGKPDNPVRLQEQRHNKQTRLWQSGPRLCGATSITLWSRVKGGLACPGEGAASPAGACPLEFLDQEGSPLGGPWEASCQVVGPSCLEAVPPGP